MTFQNEGRWNFLDCFMSAYVTSLRSPLSILLFVLTACSGDNTQERSRHAFELGQQAYNSSQYADAQHHFFSVDSSSEFFHQASAYLSKIDSMKRLKDLQESASSNQEEAEGEYSGGYDDYPVEECNTKQLTCNWLDELGREYTWREDQQLAAILFSPDTLLVRHTSKCDDTHESGVLAELRMSDTSAPITDSVYWRLKAMQVASDLQILGIYDKLLRSSPPWRITGDQQLEMVFRKHDADLSFTYTLEINLQQKNKFLRITSVTGNYSRE